MPNKQTAYHLVGPYLLINPPWVIGLIVKLFSALVYGISTTKSVLTGGREDGIPFSSRLFNFFIICSSHYDCMTAKQKVKYFKSAESQNELEEINEFISSPKINATDIASSKFGIILLYEEK